MTSVLFYLISLSICYCWQFLFSTDSTLLVLLSGAGYSLLVSLLDSFLICSLSFTAPQRSSHCSLPFSPWEVSSIQSVAQQALFIYGVLLSSRSITTSRSPLPCSKHLHITVHPASVLSNSTCLRLKWAALPAIFSSHIKWRGMPIPHLS